MVSAIVLAAGRSSRMGRMKQLLPIAGKPVIAHCLAAIANSGITEIVVVANPAMAAFFQTERKPALTVLFNTAPSSEMSDSARIGLKDVSATSSGVLIYLADYPLVTSETVRTLCETHLEKPNRILIPTYQGRSGHPCLFPRVFANEVYNDLTLKEIVHFDSNRVTLIDVPDEGILLDIDTEEDYQAMLRRVK